MTQIRHAQVHLISNKASSIERKQRARSPSKQKTVYRKSPGCLKSFLFYFFIFAMAYLVRIHRIEKGNFVTWDEAHFGKFAQKYLDRIFYFDVHPPLGKMLTALSGLIHGQSSEVDFGSKDEYPVTFDYTGMRRFHAFIASFTPLFGSLILRELRFSKRRTLLLSLLFIFENGVVSISRLILLDSHLLAFTSATIYMLVRLYNHQQSGQEKENKILPILGLCIGCVMSVKWIGCLTTLQVGMYIILDLYLKLCWMTPFVYFKYFLKRVAFLILLPITIYILLFYIHFRIVCNSGPDDGFMSSEFQVSLKNSPFSSTMKYVSYGKKITLKTPHGYLHSHTHGFPGEDQDEDTAPLQVTTYNHKDKNNNFYLQKVSDTTDASLIMDKDPVVLLHAETNGYIQLSQIDAYQSEGKRVENQRNHVSSKAVWIVEIEKDTVKKEERVKAISTRFYLKNQATGMYLCATSKVLPSWAFGQGEVISQPEKDRNCLFNVEENFFTDDPENEIYKELRPSFFSRLVEHQIAMFNTNKSFVQDPDLEPEKIVSQPYEWPILVRGLRMSQWHEQYKFYMFMNPVILYSTTLGLIVAPLAVVWRIVRYLRSSDQRSSKTLNRALKNDLFLLFVSLGGWILHYLPSYCVTRVLYLHHYFPALFFGTLNLCLLLRRVNFKVCVGYVFTCVVVFWLYSPLTYGFLDESRVNHLRILPSWDF